MSDNNAQADGNVPPAVSYDVQTVSTSQPEQKQQAYKAPPAKIANLDEVPTQLRAQYQLGDDGYYEFRHVAGLQNALKQEREAAKRNAQQVKALENQNKAVLAAMGIDASDIDWTQDDAAETIQSLIEDKKRLNETTKQVADNQQSKAAIDAALAEAEKQHNKVKVKLEVQNKQLADKLNQLQSNYKQEIIDFAIANAFSKTGLKPSKEGADILPLAIKRDLVVVESGDGTKYEVFVKPDDDNLSYRLNSSGEAMTVEEYVENHVAPKYQTLFVEQAAAPNSELLQGAVATNKQGLHVYSQKQFEDDPSLYARLVAQKIPFIVKEYAGDFFPL